MVKYVGKKFKQEYFSIDFFGWQGRKDHDYIEVEFNGGGGDYTQSGDFTISDKLLDEFLEECAKFKAWRDAR